MTTPRQSLLPNITTTFFLLLLALFYLNSIATAETVDPNEYEWVAPLKSKVTPEKLHQIPLPEEILTRCRSDLADIRLIDPNHEAQPYVLLKHEYNERLPQQIVLEVTKAENLERQNAFAIVVKLPDDIVALRGLGLQIRNVDFQKQVTVEGGHDSRMFKPITTDVIFDFSSQIDLRKTRIDFPQLTSYRYYRILFVDDEQETEAGKQLSLEYEGLRFSYQSTPGRELRIDRIAGLTDPSKNRIEIRNNRTYDAFSDTTDTDGNTIIDLEAGVPIERIAFTIDNLYFSRSVKIEAKQRPEATQFISIGSGSIYRFDLNHVHTERTILHLNAGTYSQIRITIVNKDNPPLDIRQIDLSWVRRNLFFLPETTGPFQLVFGNPRASRPEYELSQFISQNNWYDQTYEQVELGQIESNENYQAPTDTTQREQLERWFMILVIIAIAGGLLIWIVQLVKRFA